LLVFFVTFGAVAQAANKARRPMARARLINRGISTKYRKVPSAPKKFFGQQVMRRGLIPSTSSLYATIAYKKHLFFALPHLKRVPLL
jgi:hypothetical protein